MLPNDRSTTQGSGSGSSSGGNNGCSTRGTSSTIAVPSIATLPQPSSSSSSSASSVSFSIPGIVPRKRRAVEVSDLNGKIIRKAEESTFTVTLKDGNDKCDNTDSHGAAVGSSDVLSDHKGNDNQSYILDYANTDVSNKENTPHNNAPHDDSSCKGIRSYTYSGRSDSSVRTEDSKEAFKGDGEGEEEAEAKPESEKGEECRPLASDLHLIVMTHAEVPYRIVQSLNRRVCFMLVLVSTWPSAS